MRKFSLRFVMNLISSGNGCGNPVIFFMIPRLSLSYQSYFFNRAIPQCVCRQMMRNVLEIWGALPCLYRAFVWPTIQIQPRLATSYSTLFWAFRCTFAHIATSIFVSASCGRSFLCHFSLQYPLASPFVFLVESIMGEAFFSFSCWSLLWASVITPLRFCFHIT